MASITTNSEGFHYLTVNHSVNFVDPETGTHTNMIESTWRALKKSLPKHGKPKVYMTPTSLNHSVNFVDPETGTHTNMIESTWRALKKSLPKHGKPKVYMTPTSLRQKRALQLQVHHQRADVMFDSNWGDEVGGPQRTG